MPELKLYIWEGNGISAAYHDDGTLVILAESPEQARELARKSAPRKGTYSDRPDRWRDAYRGYGEARALSASIDRKPDRIIDLDKPCIVAFNGGGYD
jgi:hypothetical protein